MHTLGKFAIAVVFCGWTIVILKMAFKYGSSKQGNAFRASVGWNFEANNFLNDWKNSLIFWIFYSMFLYPIVPLPSWYKLW